MLTAIFRNLLLAAMLTGPSLGAFAAEEPDSTALRTESKVEQANYRSQLLKRLKDRQDQEKRKRDARSDKSDKSDSSDPSEASDKSDRSDKSDPSDPSVAPSEDLVLSDEDKESLQERVKDKVEEFQNYMTQLANKEITSAKVKDRCYQNALNLFIGKGEEFTVFDPDQQKDVKKEAAQILTRTGGKSKKPFYVRDYLKGLRKSKLYDAVEISDIDIVRVDKLKKVGDHYETMAYFCQKYVGYRGDKIAYADMTYKKVRIILNPLTAIASDGSEETIWNAYLYDIYTVNTVKI